MQLRRACMFVAPMDGRAAAQAPIPRTKRIATNDFAVCFTRSDRSQTSYRLPLSRDVDVQDGA